MPTAIIIEDNLDAKENLLTCLGEMCPEVAIIGHAPSVIGGAKLLRQHSPDLLFLDIELEDGTGFDLLEILPDVSAKIIFTTALEYYAVKAFRFAAVDYLLKPIDPDELKEAVEKAKVQLIANSQYQFLLHQIKEKDIPRRIALHTQEKIHIVEINDITRCEAMSNYCRFFFKNGEKLLVTKTLKAFEDLLKDHPFLRVHQSHLIHLHHLESFVKQDGGYIIMKDGAKVPVSVRKRPLVMQTLGLI